MEKAFHSFPGILVAMQVKYAGSSTVREHCSAVVMSPSMHCCICSKVLGLGVVSRLITVACCATSLLPVLSLLLFFPTGLISAFVEP